MNIIIIINLTDNYYGTLKVITLIEFKVADLKRGASARWIALSPRNKKIQDSKSSLCRVRKVCLPWVSREFLQQSKNQT